VLFTVAIQPLQSKDGGSLWVKIQTPQARGPARPPEWRQGSGEDSVRVGRLGSDTQAPTFAHVAVSRSKTVLRLMIVPDLTYVSPSQWKPEDANR